MDGCALHLPFELQRDAAEVAAKCNYVESIYPARQVHCRPSLAKGRDFLKSIQVFRSAEAQDVLGIPEHGYECLGIVGHQRRFILWIKRRQLRHYFGIIDDHRWNSFLSGRTCLGMAALTVNMG